MPRPYNIGDPLMEEAGSAEEDCYLIHPFGIPVFQEYGPSQPPGKQVFKEYEPSSPMESMFSKNTNLPSPMESKFSKNTSLSSSMESKFSKNTSLSSPMESKFSKNTSFPAPWKASFQRIRAFPAPWKARLPQKLSSASAWKGAHATRRNSPNVDGVKSGAIHRLQRTLKASSLFYPSPLLLSTAPLRIKTCIFAALKSVASCPPYTIPKERREATNEDTNN